MLLLCIFAVLIQSAISNTQCQYGSEIESKDIKNPEYLLGNWFYAYHWDRRNKYSNEFIDRGDHSSQTDCIDIEIRPIALDYVEAKELECANYSIPFNWTDAKLRIDSKEMNIKGGIIILGIKENWLMEACTTMARLVIRKVADDYVVMTNPDIAGASEMIARKIPSLEELKCISHNVDIVKGTAGLGLCYKN